MKVGYKYVHLEDNETLVVSDHVSGQCMAFYGEETIELLKAAAECALREIDERKSGIEDL